RRPSWRATATCTVAGRSIQARSAWAVAVIALSVGARTSVGTVAPVPGAEAVGSGPESGGGCAPGTVTVTGLGSAGSTGVPVPSPAPSPPPPPPGHGAAGLPPTPG